MHGDFHHRINEIGKDFSDPQVQPHPTVGPCLLLGAHGENTKEEPGVAAT